MCSLYDLTVLQTQEKALNSRRSITNLQANNKGDIRSILKFLNAVFKKKEH